MQSKLGDTRFAGAYAEVRRKAEGIRQSRRRDRLELAVTDPMAHAKRKLARNEAKKNHKKRKVGAEMEQKVTRTTKRGRNTS
jgi:U3 small nucleolar RNA-associated protein 20